MTASVAGSKPDLLQLGQFVLAMVGTTLIIGWAIRDSDLAARAADAWAVGAAVSCLVGVVDFAVHTGIGPRISGAAFLGREAGLTLQPNDLGVTAALVIPWVTLRLISVRSVRATLWWSSVLGTLTAGILVSGSRSALLAVPAGVIALLLVGRGVSRKLVPLVVGAGAILGVAAIGARFSGSQTFVAVNRLTGTSTSVAASDSTRVARYHVAVSDFLSHPIAGVGYQAIRQALDIYLQLAASGGVLALAGFAVFVLWVISADRALVRDAPAGQLRNLGGALAGIDGGVAGVRPVPERHLRALPVRRRRPHGGGGLQPRAPPGRAGSRARSGTGRAGTRARERALKVLHVIPALSIRIGGPAVAVVEACARLDSLGVETTIFTTDMALPAGDHAAAAGRPGRVPAGCRAARRARVPGPAALPDGPLRRALAGASSRGRALRRDPHPHGVPPARPGGLAARRASSASRTSSRRSARSIPSCAAAAGA